MIMLADVGTWPSDLSRRFGNVGDDAGLQDRTKMGIVDFTHHAAGPILRVGRAIGGGVNFGIRYVRRVEQGDKRLRIMAATPARYQLIQNVGILHALAVRSEEHTSELQSLMRISYS